MIEELKKLTIRNAGLKIENRGDCVLLSEIILEKTDEFISYNTLRRFFGLVTYVKPNQSTLNTIAKFNGYNNYAHYIKIAPNKAYWSEKEKLYSLINSNSDGIISYINSPIFKNEFELDFIISLCRELIYLNKEAILEEVFNSNYFNQNQFNYSEVLHFGNSVGELLKTNNKLGKKLLLNINFLNYVYCIYVDYSNLNGYYGEWSKFVFSKTNDIQLKCFAQAILELKNYLNNKKVSYSYFQSMDTSNFHPILQGRIYTIQLLSSGFNIEDLAKIIEKNSKNSDDSFLIDFSYEPITIAMLSKNFELMNAIINFLSNKKIIPKYYHEEHYNLYKLMRLFYLSWKNKFENKKVNLKIEVSDLDFKYSYSEFIHLFVLILKYHNESVNKNILNEYTELLEKINVPFISKEYLLNYFE